ITVSNLENDVPDSSESKSNLDSRKKNRDFTAQGKDVSKQCRIAKMWREHKKQSLDPHLQSKKSRKVRPTSLQQRASSGSALGSETDLCLDSWDVRPEETIERCNMILERLEKSDDSKAISFFKWMRLNQKLKKNVIAHNVILRVLTRKDDWDGAEGLVKEMVSDSGCLLNYQIFNTVIYACYKKGLSDVATRWFKMMLNYQVDPNVATYGMLMSLYQKNWAVEEAESTLTHMRKLKITCNSAYSSMITIYIRLGLYKKAEDVVGFLRDDQVVLDQQNWLALLNAYCQQGKLPEAEQTWLSMMEAGFRPSLVAYNTMITGCGRASRMDHAEKFYFNLREEGLEPDETTYRSLIEGWGRAGNYIQADSYYKELRRIGFNPSSSNLFTLIKLQALNEDSEGSVKYVDDMMSGGVSESSIIGILLRAYGEANRLDRLPFILETTVYNYVCRCQTSGTALVSAYVKRGFIDEALKVLKDKLWDDPVFEDNLYHLLICSCKDAGHLENAVRVFTHMPKSDKPNLNIYCTMIDVFSKTSMFSEADTLYSELIASGTKLDMIAFSIVIRMYSKSGSLNKACNVIDSMTRYSSDIVPDVYLLRDMLRIYQQCGMNERLSDLYGQLLKRGEIWDQEMYNCIINCCSNALPVDELSRLLEEMLHRGFIPNTITLNVMLDAYGKSRLFEKARKVFWMGKKQGLIDVISYNILISAYGKNKCFDRMTATVKQMQFDGFSVSLEAYNCMLDAYGKEGEMEKLRSILQLMKASNCKSDHYTGNILINIYGMKGWIEEVSEVLMELKESGIRPDLCSYNTLIKAYGIAGMVEDAVGLVKEMRDKGVEPDRVTYINLIAALRRNDLFLEAVKWSLWMKQQGL
ncbi:hypothetical protein M569_09839, partial [Genlisea aurea]